MMRKKIGHEEATRDGARCMMGTISEMAIADYIQTELSLIGEWTLDVTQVTLMAQRGWGRGIMTLGEGLSQALAGQGVGMGLMPNRITIKRCMNHKEAGGT